jgi:hypothetical protein
MSRNEIVAYAKDNRHIIQYSLGAVKVVIVWLNLQQHVQSVPITTKVLSSNPAHGGVYLIQQYVIRFVSYMRQVGGFHRVLRIPPPIKLIATI